MENKQHNTAPLQKTQTKSAFSCAIPVQGSLFCSGVCRQCSSCIIILYHLAWKKSRSVSPSYAQTEPCGTWRLPCKEDAAPRDVEGSMLALPRPENVEVHGKWLQSGSDSGLHLWGPQEEVGWGAVPSEDRHQEQGKKGQNMHLAFENRVNLGELRPQWKSAGVCHAFLQIPILPQ